MGFASSPATRQALAPYGIRVGGYRWRWALGLKGGTYPPHYHQNNEFASDAGEFEALPGEDVNGDSCACNLVPVYRTPDGRFAKPGLTPIFQPPPVTAALERYIPEPLDLTPFHTLLSQFAPQPTTVQVTIPDGAIVVNIPRQEPPTINVDATSTSTPTVNVAAPSVSVQAPTVNVAGPTISNDVASPEITVEPTKLQVVKSKPRRIRILRDDRGQITGAEETDQ